MYQYVINVLRCRKNLPANSHYSRKRPCNEARVARVVVGAVADRFPNTEPVIHRYLDLWLERTLHEAADNSVDKAATLFAYTAAVVLSVTMYCIHE